MRILIALLAAAGVGFAAEYVMVSSRLHERHAAELASQQAAWQAEKEQWQGEMEQARRQAHAVAPAQRFAVPVAATSAILEVTAGKLAPRDILERLKSLKIVVGPGGVQSQREMVRLLDDLVRYGPSALPVIRDYLASNADVDLALAQGKGKGPPGQQDGWVPSTLRAGLFGEPIRRSLWQGLSSACKLSPAWPKSLPHGYGLATAAVSPAPPTPHSSSPA